MSTAEIPLKDYGSRDAWLASRSGGIGASEAAALFTDENGKSLSPYQTPFALYLEKRGEIAPVELDGEWIKWGNILEEPIAAQYAAETGRQIWRAPSPYAVAEHPCAPLFATPDRWVIEAPDRDGAGLLQIKNAGAYMAHDWKEGVPQHIQIQVQAEMAVTGRDWDSVAVLIGGNTYKHFDVERNQEFISELEDQARDFWDMVQRGEPPDIDGSERTLEAIKRLHPLDNGCSVRLPEEAVEWFAALEEAKAHAKAAEENIDAAKAKLLAAIGSNTYGVLADGRILSLKTTSKKGGMREIAPSCYRTLRLESKPPKGKRA
jgi:putative phage-type endonuclease